MIMMDCTSKETLRKVQRLARDCTQFLHLYQWVIDAYVSDFFTHNHWEHLSASWRDALLQMEPPELAFLLQRNFVNQSKVLPLSLLAYRCCCHTYSLPRDRWNLNHSGFKEIFQKNLAGQNEHIENDLHIKSIQQSDSVSIITRQVGTTSCDNVTQTEGADISKGAEENAKSKNKSKSVSERNNTKIEVNTNSFKFQPHSGISEGQGQASSQIKDGQYLPLQHCFRKHVKPKKQHEILQLGQVIHMLGKACNCSHVVDIGAGQGHLSRILNFGFGLKVTTVEAADCHAPKAQKFDKDMKRDIDRSKTKLKRKMVDDTPEAEVEESHSTDNIPLPDHVTCIIQPDTSVENFLDVVQSSFRKHLNDLDSSGCERSGLVSYSQNPNNNNPDNKKSVNSINDCLKGGNQETECEVDDKSDKMECDISSGDSLSKSNVKFLMTGLHACGDLTATMIRVYSKCPDIIGLASVSCCYMKLTCDGSESSLTTKDCSGYPLSQYLQSIPDNQLSYEAREMACHFADSYSRRLKDNPPNLKLHCYRAALQFIVAKLNPNFQRGCIKLTVKNAENMEFKKYALIGLERLGIHTELPDSLLKEAESFIPLWKKVVIFYTIRLSLAPVVETLILLDRMLFLYEKGFTCNLVPIFDPELSPRNFVLLSKKN